jgi:hypothetical protein
MKSISKFLLLMTFTGFIFSCKKSSESSSGYYVKANFDGTEKNFNTSATAVKSKLGDATYNLTITGLTNTEEGAITLWSDKDDFVAGKAYAIQATNGSTNILSYISPLGSSDAASIWTTTYSYGTVDLSFSCTITEATSTYIKGTFSGVIYQNIESSVVSKTVTSGSFYAKY